METKYSEKDSNLQPAPSSIPVLQILEKGDALSKIELSEHVTRYVLTIVDDETKIVAIFKIL